MSGRLRGFALPTPGMSPIALSINPASAIARSHSGPSDHRVSGMTEEEKDHDDDENDSPQRCRSCASRWHAIWTCAPLDRRLVVATAVRVLDRTLMRVGNDEYARHNQSYGLTTLLDEAGEAHRIGSEDINDYVRESTGGDFTAKDFRTWNATLRAIQIMHSTPLPQCISERALAGCIAQAVKQVAAGLRNTPTVCRKSYINPIVFDAWRCGALHDAIREQIARAPRKAERIVATFLRRQAARAAREVRRAARVRAPAHASRPRARRTSTYRRPDAPKRAFGVDAARS